MKKFLCMIFMAVFTFAAIAQDGPGKVRKPEKPEIKKEHPTPKPPQPIHKDKPLKMFRYQGELSLSYGINMEWVNSIVNLELINGIRFTPNFFAGVGIGGSASFEDSFYVPLFVDFKGYFPVGKRLDLIAGADLGTQIDCYSSEGFGGFMFRPEFGINIRMGERYGLNLVLQYEFFTQRDYLIINNMGFNYRIKKNKIGLKFGFSF